MTTIEQLPSVDLRPYLETILDMKPAFFAYLCLVQRCARSYGLLLVSGINDTCCTEIPLPTLLLIKYAFGDKECGIYANGLEGVYLNDEDKPFVEHEMDITDSHHVRMLKWLRERSNSSKSHSIVYITTPEFLLFNFDALLAGTKYEMGIKYYLDHYTALREQTTKIFRSALERSKSEIRISDSIKDPGRYTAYVEAVKSECSELSFCCLSITDTNQGVPLTNTMLERGVHPKDIVLIIDILWQYHHETKKAIQQRELKRALQA